MNIAQNRWLLSRRRFMQLSGLAALCSALGIPVSVVYADPIPMKTNTVILSGSSWLGGNGVSVYSNDGSYDSNDKDLNYVNIGTAANPNNVQSGYRWQCVELINRLYLTQGWITSRWTGNAYQMYDNAPSGFSKELDGSISSVGSGDVIVFTGGVGGNGHVLIVDSLDSDGKTIHTVSQNLMGTNPRRDLTWDTTNKKISTWTGYSTKGIVHSSTTPTTTTPPPIPSTPVAVSRTSSTMAVFFNDGNNHLANWSWDASYGWAFQQWPDDICGQPAAITRTSDSMDVFYRTAEQKLIHRGWTAAGGWGLDVLLSSDVAGDPAAVSRDSGDMQIFFCTAASEVKSVSWNWQTGWNTNAQLLYSGKATSDPVAISRSSSGMDVFFEANGNQLVHLGWSASNGWGTDTWSANGITGRPTAITRNGGGDMSCYYQETNGRVAEESWDWQTSWAWQDWQAQLVGSPSAIPGVSNVIDVFYRETGGNIVDRAFTGYGWVTNNVVGVNSATGNPFALVRGSNIEVFYWNGSTLMDAHWDATNGWSTAPIG